LRLGVQERPLGSTTGLAPPDAILDAIYKWWCDDKDVWIRKYENTTFPDGRPIIPKMFGVEGDAAVRKEWLKIFLLGATHTMGRIRQEQNKSFLNKCDREGWLETFSQPGQDPAIWLQVLKDYFDQESTEIEFHLWMKQLFVVIFQFAKWLPEYTDSFLAINQYRTPFPLTDILRPRTNPTFQGGGPDAPPITRTLGMGANFVVRELVRNGVITNKHAVQHCYVPFLSLRRLIIRLSCDLDDHQNNPWNTSTHIYRHLVKHLGPERATFDGAFDIPLFIISRDTELFESFFHESLPQDDETNEDLI
jgi:hypothetical protein